MTQQPFNLPWIMHKLRTLVESYETVPYADDPDVTACVRVTYWDRASNSGITLVVGTEAAINVDTEDDG